MRRLPKLLAIAALAAAPIGAVAAAGPASAQPSQPARNCTFSAQARWNTAANPDWAKEWVTTTNCSDLKHRVHITCTSQGGLVYNFYGPAKYGAGFANYNDSYANCYAPRMSLQLQHVWWAYYYSGAWHNKYKQFR